MPDFSIEVSPDEFVNSCHKREIKELIECLQEEGHIKGNLHPLDSSNILDDEWFEVCDKLNDSRLRLTLEEEETIKKIASRL